MEDEESLCVVKKENITLFCTPVVFLLHITIGLFFFS